MYGIKLREEQLSFNKTKTTMSIIQKLITTIVDFTGNKNKKNKISL